MVFQSFCGVATLQVGVCILATVFLLVAWTVFAVNVFNYYDEPTISWPAPLFFIIVFVILMAFSGLVMFFAVYDEGTCEAITALMLVVLTMVFWLFMSVVSFENSPTNLKIVCNHLKCPESFWLAELSYRDWRKESMSCKPQYNYTQRSEQATTLTTLTTLPYEPSTLIHSGPTEELPDNTDVDYIDVTFPTVSQPHGNTGQRLKVLPTTIGSVSQESSPEGTDKQNHLRALSNASQDESARYVFKEKFAGAIILFIINLLFLIFSSLMLLSYYRELVWIKRNEKAFVNTC